MLMKGRKCAQVAAILGGIALLIPAPPAQARSRDNSLFEYVAGTEPLPAGCAGKLEVTQEAMVFQCMGASIAVPYDSVTEMEYRQRISKKIRKMKLDWAVKPPSSRSKHKPYFSVLYSRNGRTCSLILKVYPDTMRPYLAEIGLKTGRPINSRKD